MDAQPCAPADPSDPWNSHAAPVSPRQNGQRESIALWIPVARASGGRPAALHVTDDTARHLRYTSRAKREADVSLSHRCTMEHPVAPWSTTMRRVFHPETNGES